jgi:hypothetical protein
MIVTVWHHFLVIQDSECHIENENKELLQNISK